MKTKVCPICNEEFTPWKSTQKYCSRDCFGESQWVEYPKHICDFCGEEFRRDPSKIKQKNRYCSLECAGKARRGICMRKKGRKRRNFICEWCGEECVQENYSDNNIQRFCNISCSNKMRWYKIKESRKNESKRE